jgi:hypothetical protein
MRHQCTRSLSCHASALVPPPPTSATTNVLGPPTCQQIPIPESRTMPLSIMPALSPALSTRMLTGSFLLRMSSASDSTCERTGGQKKQRVGVHAARAQTVSTGQSCIIQGRQIQVELGFPGSGGRAQQKGFAARPRTAARREWVCQHAFFPCMQPIPAALSCPQEPPHASPSR